MASTIHAILPRLAIIIGLPLAALFVVRFFRTTRPYELASDEDIFAVVEGRWAWSTRKTGCEDDWHRIAFTADHQVMTITSSQPYEGADGGLDSVAVYDIQAHAQGWIRGAIRGETRLTAAGEPAVWDLVLRSRDRYAWHRTDWLPGVYTAHIERCSDASSKQ